MNTVKIKMTGGRYGDFRNANEIAGYLNSKGNITGRSHPIGYTWHHLNDYDPITNTTTMQLVKIEAHKATYPHAGSVSQFEEYHQVKYETPQAKAKAKDFFTKASKKC
ncbi:HNH endonuclease [Snodgrassella alvi]|uniref:HNH endonuclease signature motif containing protein n=1 Tax=Snodgrassella alvi TaxID=1196083 RepID=UPI0034602A12